jgi:hypothetical protein
MIPRKTPETTQMKLLFCDSKPIMLPDDKQRELNRTGRPVVKCGH